MDQALFALPILPGKTGAARAFLQEMDGPRKQELAMCSQGAGLTKEAVSYTHLTLPTKRIV